MTSAHSPAHISSGIHTKTFAGARTEFSNECCREDPNTLFMSLQFMIKGRWRCVYVSELVRLTISSGLPNIHEDCRSLLLL